MLEVDPTPPRTLHLTAVSLHLHRVCLYVCFYFQLLLTHKTTLYKTILLEMKDSLHVFFLIDSDEGQKYLNQIASYGSMLLLLKLATIYSTCALAHITGRGDRDRLPTAEKGAAELVYSSLRAVS
jgi:hypothetical protein